MTSTPTVAGSVAGISAAVLLFSTLTVGIVPAVIVGGAVLLGGLLMGLRKMLQNRIVPEAILRVREDLEKISKKYKIDLPESLLRTNQNSTLLDAFA